MSALRKPRVARAVPPPVPTVDPSLPDARKRILAMFPTILRPVQVAPPEARALVAEYAEARSLAKACETSQETAGSALALLIGDAAGIAGDGFMVTWDATDGRTNWQAVAMHYARALKAEGIAVPPPEDFRGAPTRTLRVTLAGKS